MNKTAAIIGYGKMGKIYHSILLKMGFEVAICDPNIEGLIKDYRDLGLEFVEYVFVTTPPNLHFEIGKYFLGLDKKVFLEKPPAINFNQAQSLKQSGSKNLYCGYHAAFNRLFEVVSKLIGNTAIKSIEVINAENIYNYHAPDSWVMDPTVSGGGCLMDNGINTFSVLYNFVDVTGIQAYSQKSRQLPVEDLVQAQFTFNSINEQGLISYSSDWLAAKDNEIRVFKFVTEDSEIVVNQANNTIVLNGKLHDFDITRTSEYERMVIDTFEYFETGKTKLKFDFFEPIELVLGCYKVANQS